MFWKLNALTQKLKTRVVKNNVNPEWNEDLTLSISDPNVPIKLVSITRRQMKLQSIQLTRNWQFTLKLLMRIWLQCWLQTVYDKDTFSLDDKMGDAEFYITPFLEALKMRLEGLPNGTIVTKIQPSRENCLAEESHIVWTDGKLVQNLFLRLRNVEVGEVEIQLEWIDIPGSRGL